MHTPHVLLMPWKLSPQYKLGGLGHDYSDLKLLQQTNENGESIHAGFSLYDTCVSLLPLPSSTLKDSSQRSDGPELRNRTGPSQQK
jgi:hypothetical protein